MCKLELGSFAARDGSIVCVPGCDAVQIWQPLQCRDREIIQWHMRGCSCSTELAAGDMYVLLWMLSFVNGIIFELFVNAKRGT